MSQVRALMPAVVFKRRLLLVLHSINKEEVYMPWEVLPRYLDPKGVAIRYLQEIRNEAHRFAITYHKLLRSKRAVGKEAPLHR